MSYDLTDRVMDEVAADGAQVSYRYAGNTTYQTNELGGVASRTFDATGNPTTDRLGNAMTKVTDPSVRSTRPSMPTTMRSPW